jgi:hypothetical protein
MAAYVELFMDQGATFNNIITLSDDLTKEDVNIAGYVIKSQMRRSYYSKNATANIICTITDASNGEITMYIDAANTALIQAGRYLFDVEMLDPLNEKTRILEGIITVAPEITKI